MAGRWVVARAALTAALLIAVWPAARAALFEDDEARKAILDLRNRVTQLEEGHGRQLTELTKANAQLSAQVATLQRSMLELNSQLELMRADVARLRGNDEQLLRDLAEVQRSLKDGSQNFDDRLRKLEPQTVSLDGKEFVAGPAERRAYDDAIALLRGGDFAAAAAALEQFQVRYPNSGYTASARFWHGNALYGKRDYKGAITAFRDMVAAAPDHPKAPEALLALANSQAEMKDTRGARKTIEQLLKAYPQSEAAAAAKDRLAALR
ncbi:MAG: tol-pal system protein YbgF [Rubrivivax sp.]|nr:tol-pal system protein YbgF [Rubrivivax sp.]MDH5338520.1 tol-pal system protein YbgF [Rubrivivax sp.]